MCSEPAAQRRVIVVLGMHRSGTSALTRGLAVLGVGLGDCFLPPMPEVNAKGFWEDAEILGLNIELLAALGCAWDVPGFVDAEAFAGPEMAALFERAVALLARRLDAHPLFGFKDPRLSRLLPFWQRVFAALGVEVGHVIALRNPLSVAQSLLRRDRMPLQLGYILWLEHMVSAVRGAKGPAVVVDYDRLLADPQGQLERVARALALTAPAAGSAAVLDYHQFLDAGLRHHVNREEDALADSLVPVAVERAFGLLSDLACDRLAFDAAGLMARFAGFTAALTDWEQAQDKTFAEMVRLRAEATGLRAETIGRATECERMAGQMACLEQEKVALVAERDFLAARLRQIEASGAFRLSRRLSRLAVWRR